MNYTDILIIHKTIGNDLAYLLILCSVIIIFFTFLSCILLKKKIDKYRIAEKLINEGHERYLIAQRKKKNAR